MVESGLRVGWNKPLDGIVGFEDARNCSFPSLRYSLETFSVDQSVYRPESNVKVVYNLNPYIPI